MGMKTTRYKTKKIVKLHCDVVLALGFEMEEKNIKKDNISGSVALMLILFFSFLNCPLGV